MATEVRSDQPKPGGRLVEDVLPIWTGTHEPVEPQQRLPVTSYLVMQIDSVDLDNHRAVLRLEVCRARRVKTSLVQPP